MPSDILTVIRLRASFDELYKSYKSSDRCVGLIKLKNNMKEFVLSALAAVVSAEPSYQEFKVTVDGSV